MNKDFPNRLGQIVKVYEYFKSFLICSVLSTYIAFSSNIYLKVEIEGLGSNKIINFLNKFKNIFMYKSLIKDKK
jgi:hypothetical protein